MAFEKLLESKAKNGRRSSSSSQSKLNSSTKHPQSALGGRNHTPSRRRKRQTPSEEALQLSSQLKAFSTQKRLRECLDLYWASEIRDEHHACIVVDCAARCGNIREGERVVDALDGQCNVETRTALLKGYVHAGQMDKAVRLFRTMCRSPRSRDRPNVRTLNTFLRGCLWAAVSVDRSNSGKILGGVVSAEEAWALCSRFDTAFFDASSYEYYIVQLCFALRPDEAKARIDEMKQRFGVIVEKDGQDFRCEDVSVAETLAVAYLSLARSMALLNDQSETRSASRLALAAVKAAGELRGNRNSGDGGRGGKRGWRQQEVVGRRQESNQIFRSHRLSEIREEARSILKLADKPTDEKIPVVRQIATRLFYFSGGGTTGVIEEASSATTHINRKRLEADSMTASWYSFGLGQLVKDTHIDTGGCALSKSQVKNVKNSLGLSGKHSFHTDCRLDFAQVFGCDDTSRVHLELGSGCGDWIVGQAQRCPNKQYVAVELRADRVSQAFSRAIMAGISNLCCVGAECGSFLRNRVRKQSVEAVYVNHPEPPTQTFGSNDELLDGILGGELAEPAHMLNSATLRLALECLDPALQGKLVIVTDNWWYAKLIGVTMARTLGGADGTFFSVDLSKYFETAESVTTVDNKSKVVIYQGQPNEAIGHATSTSDTSRGGASYFDRLWRSGAGTHAETKVRYLVVVGTESHEDKAASSRKKRKRKLGRRERKRLKKQNPQAMG